MRRAILVALIASCSIDHATTELACTTPADCDAMRTCSNGYCVIAAESCPGGCTTCDLTAKTCELAGNGNGKLTCPTGFHCTITCGNNACRDVDCDAAASCVVACTGNNSCDSVKCGAGACAITCDGAGSCADVDCRDSCACDVTCAGAGSCDGARCPDSCTSGMGCSSQATSCDSC